MQEYECEITNSTLYPYDECLYSTVNIFIKERSTNSK